MNLKDVKVGEKYSYRVQSFIDDNGKKLITSDESYAEESGWLINTPSISVSSTYMHNLLNYSSILQLIKDYFQVVRLSFRL